MASEKWTKDQVKLAFHLYCQLPFGKLHQRNKETIQLASLIGRTPSAVAMKMCNIASLDPAIINSGRSGLGNASTLDKEVWDEFHQDWERLTMACEKIKNTMGNKQAESIDDVTTEDFFMDDYTGQTKKVLTEQRVKQNFFRKAVLSSYNHRCCITGLSDPRLLVASHIVPWSKDKANRLNPSNGLCLSAIHDKAFDKGLLSLTDNFEIVLSKEIKKQDCDFSRMTFFKFEGKKIEMPEKFYPEQSFISFHRKNIFVG